MNLIGVIAAGAAFANYQKAKEDYKKVIAEEQALAASYLAAISTYNEHKWDEYDKYNKEIQDQNSEVDGLQVVPILNIGNLSLGRKSCRVMLQLCFTNTSDKTISIRGKFAYVVYLFKVPLLATVFTDKPITIKPKQQLYIQLAANNLLSKSKISADNFIEDVAYNIAADIVSGYYPITDEIVRLREYFTKNGVNSITHVYGGNVQITTVKVGTILTGYYNAESGDYLGLRKYLADFDRIDKQPIVCADVSFEYCDNENKNIRRALYLETMGSAIYQGEPYQPIYEQ